MRVLKTKKNFWKELKRQLKYAIAAAVGFLIAFAWKDAIYNAVHEIVVMFEDSTKGVTSEVSTAIVITVIGVLIILLSSKLLKDKK
jgi:hypothetical protein